MICPYCGAELPERVVACGSCGRKLNAPAKRQPPRKAQAAKSRPKPRSKPKKKSSAIPVLAVVAVLMTALCAVVLWLGGGAVKSKKQEDTRAVLPDLVSLCENAKVESKEMVGDKYIIKFAITPDYESAAVYTKWKDVIGQYYSEDFGAPAYETDNAAYYKLRKNGAEGDDNFDCIISKADGSCVKLTYDPKKIRLEDAPEHSFKV